MGKSDLKSKTIWVNVLALVASILACVAGQDFIKNQETLLATVIAIQGAVNIALRLVTKQPIDKSTIVNTLKTAGTLAVKFLRWFKK